MSASTPSTNNTTTTATSNSNKPTLLTLPFELRHQIYHHVFSNLALKPFAQAAICQHYDCERYEVYTLSTPLLGSQTSPFVDVHLFKPHLSRLTVCKQIYTEASPIFYSTLTLTITSPTTLDRIHASTPPALRARIHKLGLTLHLNDDTRYSWYQSLTALPATFPSLSDLTIHNHMRSPMSYDRLVDAVHLCAPLVSGPLAQLRQTLEFNYARDETMFESPFLGDVTTQDSLEAHEAVIRDLMRDEGFVLAAREEDFEVMTARLLFVARGHEERWLVGLQRRRLEGLSSQEVRERVQRGVMAEVGMEVLSGDGEPEEEGGVWDE